MILSVWNFGVDFSLMKNTQQNKGENKAENKAENNAKIKPMTTQFFFGFYAPIFFGFQKLGRRFQVFGSFWGHNWAIIGALLGRFGAMLRG